MTIISLDEHPGRFRWSDEPARWDAGPPLEVTTRPDTDYWQRTHYGFRRDNGHFLSTPVGGDFVLTAHVAFAPTGQYDQCGLMVRVDADTWIKCSVEYETPTLSRLGSVVTNLGFSDWATQDVPSTVTQMWYTIRREGSDFLLAWADDGQDWRQMRVAHLHTCPDEIEVGFYACSPTGAGFTCRVHALTLDSVERRQMSP
ncbi:MAG: DUF1349 domain-containing protein [Anaerolineae bacterium]